jgi:peptidoglycan/LPS O-acetylase OafA/YrhL
MVLLILAVVVTVSCATYHYVELKGQGLGRQLLRRRMVTAG